MKKVTTPNSQFTSKNIVYEIGKLDVNKNDIIILKFKMELTQDQKDLVIERAKELSELFVDNGIENPIIICGDEFDLELMTEADLKKLGYSKGDLTPTKDDSDVGSIFE